MPTLFRRSAFSIALFAVLAALSRAAAALPTPPGTSLFTVTPCRILDTRNPDGPLGGPALAAGETRVFTATGVCTIPAGATGLAVNVTVTQPAAPGFLQSFPGDAPPPATSLLNFAAGQTRANNAVVSLASDGSGTFAVRNASAGTAHVVVDVAAYFERTCLPIDVSPASLPPGTAGTAYSQTVTASGGFAPYDYAVTSGALPDGLGLDTATGAITGTPSTTGPASFSITATDSRNCTGNRAYSVLVCAPISLSPSTLPNGSTTAAYSQTITASGGTAPHAFTVTSGALPPGLTLTPAGVLSGTPTQGGTFPFDVTATDAAGCTGSRSYTLVVDCPTITVNPESLPRGFESADYSQTLTGSGGTAPYSFAVTSGSLPANLTLTSGGVLSGTPLAPGSTTFTVTTTDAAGCTAARVYTLVVCGTLGVSPPSLPGGSVGVPYSQALSASGSTAPYTFAVTSGTLPSGLSLASDGILSGTPTAPGSYAFTVTATDANGCTGARGYTIVVCGTIAVAPATLPNGTTGTAYSQSLTASGSSAPYTFAVTSGSLPANLTLTTAGLISGTPTATGTASFTVTATDANGCTGTKDYTLQVVCPVIALTPAAGALSDGLYNQLYGLSAFTAAGGTAPVTLAVTAGALPPGFALATDGSLTTHTPTTTGSFSFTITATDANGCTGSAAYTLTVRPVATADAYGTGVGNTQLAVAASCPSGISTPNVCVAGSVLGNDSGPGTLSAGLFSAPANGAVAINANGTFTYTPNAGFAGPSDSFVYSLTDGNLASNVATVTITLSGRVWYVNNAGGSDSATRGRSHEPLATVAQAVTNASAGDTLFVHSGSAPYAGATLSKSLTLWGQGTAFTLNSLAISAGAKPALNTTLTVAANNVTISSLDVSTGASTGITNSGAVSGLTVKNGVAVTTTTGTAVSFSNVNSTAGGAPNNGINFLAVSANGGANGIFLSGVNTTSGTFSVLGSGSAGSGGTIQNLSGADGTTAGSGVYLSNSKNVSLASLQLHDFQNYAIRGLDVTGFTLADSTIGGVNGTNASGDGEGSVYFDGLYGTGGISASTISGALVDNLHVASSSGALTSFLVTGCTITDNSVASGNVGIQFLSKATASMTATVQNSTFHGNRTVALRGDAADGSTLNVTFTGNTIVAGSPNQGNQGIEISKAVTSNVTFVCDGNKVGTPDGTTVQPLGNTGINIFSGSTAGSMTGTVKNNVVINAGAGVSGFGIRVFNSNLGTMNVNVANNTVGNVGLDYGILCESSGAASPGGLLAVALTGNTSNVLAGALDALRVQARNFNQVCATVSGNTSTSAGSGFVGLTVRQANSAVFNLEGLAAGAQSAATTQAYAASQNPGVTDGVLGLAATNFTGVSGGSCGITP